MDVGTLFTLLLETGITQRSRGPITFKQNGRTTLPSLPSSCTLSLTPFHSYFLLSCFKHHPHNHASFSISQPLYSSSKISYLMYISLIFVLIAPVFLCSLVQQSATRLRVNLIWTLNFSQRCWTQLRWGHDNPISSFSLPVFQPLSSSLSFIVPPPPFL